MARFSNPENDEYYHQKIIEQYSNEEKAAQKTAETTEKTLKQKETATKKYLKAVEKAYKEQIEKEFRDIEFSHQMGYMSDEQYYNKMAILRDKYFEKGSEEWQKYTLKINKYHLEMVEQQKQDIISLYDEISKEAQKAINDAEKKYEKLYNKLSGSTPLATKHTATFVGQGAGLVLENGTWRNHKDYVVEEYRLTDFKEETEKLEKLYNLFNAIKNKGVSNEFLSQFTNMSADDMLGTANALLSMKDEDFNNFYTSWQRFQSVADATAYKLTEPDRESIINEYGSLGDDLKQSLTDAFGTIPENFYEYGMLSAEEFGKGFASRVNAVQTYVSSGGGYSTNSGGESGNSDMGETSDSTTTSNTYNFYGSDKTDGERLYDVMRFNEITRMRGE